MDILKRNEVQADLRQDIKRWLDSGFSSSQLADAMVCQGEHGPAYGLAYALLMIERHGQGAVEENPALLERLVRASLHATIEQAAVRQEPKS